MTRRDLLSGAATCAVAAPLCGGISLYPRVAHAEIFTILAVVAAAVGIIRQFVGKGDGGLSAMLQANNATLNLIVDNISKIQEALADIREQLGKIPEQVAEITHLGWSVAYTEQVFAALGRWREVFTGRSDFRVPANDASRSLVENIFFRMQEARAILSENHRGVEPIAAAIAPTALGLEVNLYNALYGPNNQLKNIMRTYIAWMDRLLDPTLSRSTAYFLRTLSEDRAARLNALAGLPTVQATGFSPSTRRSQKAAFKDGCVVQYKPEEEICRFRRGEESCHTNHARFGAEAYWVGAWMIDAKETSGVSVMNLKYEEAGRAPEWAGSVPRSCVQTRIPINADPLPHAQSFLNTTRPELDRARSLITQINDLEIRILFMSECRKAGEQTRERAKAYLNSLS